MELLGEVSLFGNGLVRGNLGGRLFGRGFLNRGLLSAGASAGTSSAGSSAGASSAAVSSTAFGSSLQQGHLGREAKIFFAHATI